MVKSGLLLAGAAVCGGSAMMIYYNRQTITRALWRWRLSRVVHDTVRRVVLVENIEQWEQVQRELLSSCESLGCVGFDCEWVTTKNRRRPVALLQLATHTGLCVLVRLCKMESIPSALLSLLSDRSVYKVGVGPVEDCKLLWTDYTIMVNGALDLRDFFVVPPSTTKQSKEKKESKKQRKRRLKEEEATNRSNNREEDGNLTQDLAQSSNVNAADSDAELDGQPDISDSILNVNDNDDVSSTLNEDENNGATTNTNNNNDVSSTLNEDENNGATTNTNDNDNVSSTLNEDENNGATTNTNNNDDVSSTLNEDENNGATTNTNNNVTTSVNKILKVPSRHPSTSRSCRVIAGVTGPTKLGLSSLAEFYLGRSLDKDWRVRASDWEDDILSLRQISYAAEDARSGLHVLLVVLEHLNVYHAAVDGNGVMAPITRWVAFTRLMIQTAAVDLARSSPQDGWSVVTSKKYSENNSSSATESNNKSYRRAYSLRKTPLYHNSVLWAPDNEPLCTVDPKKARWYVLNNLGDVVQEDPLIVRLNFEPTGRPQKEGNDGYFYLYERLNVCVVCGKDESYIRKNVVPHEYRKHFPEVLKSHQNHDVVLLCTVCHQFSNQRDALLRYDLAEKHNAPIGNATDVKVVVDGDLKVIKSAGKALERKIAKIPECRVKVLRDTLKDYFKTDDLTDDLIKKAAYLDISIVNDSYEPHGLRVYNHYKLNGVIHFEKLWRENFLKTMKPEHMPTGWSVSHNHEKLKLKMSRHPLDDPIREQYKLALVGTEGNIDIPYIIQKHLKKTVPKSTQSSDSEEKSSSNTPDREITPESD